MNYGKNTFSCSTVCKTIGFYFAPIRFFEIFLTRAGPLILQNWNDQLTAKEVYVKRNIVTFWSFFAINQHHQSFVKFLRRHFLSDIFFNNWTKKFPLCQLYSGMWLLA